MENVLTGKRITIFAGHYGSGKTNIAVNYALALRKKYPNKDVALADLDIVNPYFRTKDSADIMRQNGIRLISSEFANSNVDLPALPPDTYAIFDNKEIFGVIDVGGDDRGALAMGRYTPRIIEDGSYDFIFVINKFRPLTKNVDDTVTVMAEIEQAAGMKFTGIANNSNLGDITTAEDVLSSAPYAEEIAKKTGLEIKMTTVKKSLEAELRGKIKGLAPITLYVKQSWEEM